MENGESCRRSAPEGIQQLLCPSPEGRELARTGLYCKPHGRLHVKLGEDDNVWTFVFRTTGFNSIRTLAPH